MVCCPYDGTLLGSDRCAGCDKPLDAEWRTCPWCRLAAPEPTTPVARALQISDVSPEVWPGAQHLAAPVPLPRLLVVSADPEVRARVEDALRGQVEVHAVSSADEGLVLTSAGRVDGALVDTRLPDLPGVELVRLLRAEPESLAMPLAVCGDSAAAVADTAREAGADVCFDKPLRAQDLLERLLPLLTRAA
jgi:CheY-like chemotaxis protein